MIDLFSGVWLLLKKLKRGSVRWLIGKYCLTAWVFPGTHCRRKRIASSDLHTWHVASLYVCMCTHIHTQIIIIINFNFFQKKKKHVQTTLTYKCQSSTIWNNPNWKQSKCPSPGEWISEQWHSWTGKQVKGKVLYSLFYPEISSLLKSGTTRAIYSNVDNLEDRISEKLNANDCTEWLHLDCSRNSKSAVTKSCCSQWDDMGQEHFPLPGSSGARL